MASPGSPIPTRPLGHVTSSYYSSNLERSIALGLIAGGRARLGERLYVATGGGDVPVTVTPSVFYDVKGGRINA
jgi:sarcosine oxidase subunit alpha